MDRRRREKDLGAPRMRISQSVCVCVWEHLWSLGGVGSLTFQAISSSRPSLDLDRSPPFVTQTSGDISFSPLKHELRRMLLFLYDRRLHNCVRTAASVPSPTLSVIDFATLSGCFPSEINNYSSPGHAAAHTSINVSLLFCFLLLLLAVKEYIPLDITN